MSRHRFPDSDYTSACSTIDLSKLNALKAMCKAIGIATSGRKADLQSRLQALLLNARAENNTLKFRALHTIVLKAHAGQAPPRYEVVYAALANPAVHNALAEEQTGDASTNATGSAGATNSSSPAALASAAADARARDLAPSLPPASLFTKKSDRPWLYFVESPFYKLKRLVHSTPKMAFKAPDSRGTCNIDFVLNHQEQLLLSAGPQYQLFLLSGVYSRSAPPHKKTHIQFPQPIEIHFNKTLVKENVKGIKNKPGTARPANLTSLVRQPPHNNSLEIIYAFAKEDFLIYCHIVETIPPEKLVTQIVDTRSHISKEATMAHIKKEYQESDDSDDLIEMSTTLSVKCPLSYTKMKYPARSVRCQHLQCFDCLSFLQLQEQAPTWTCPICNDTISVSDLTISDYLADIIANTDDDTEVVELLHDGNWKAITENENKSSRPSEQPHVFKKDDSLEVNDLVPNNTNNAGNQNINADTSNEAPDIEIISLDSESDQEDNEEANEIENELEKELENVEENGEKEEGEGENATHGSENEATHDSEDDRPLSTIRRPPRILDNQSLSQIRSSLDRAVLSTSVSASPGAQLLPVNLSYVQSVADSPSISAVNPPANTVNPSVNAANSPAINTNPPSVSTANSSANVPPSIQGPLPQNQGPIVNQSQNNGHPSDSIQSPNNLNSPNNHPSPNNGSTPLHNPVNNSFSTASAVLQQQSLRNSDFDAHSPNPASVASYPQSTTPSHPPRPLPRQQPGPAPSVPSQVSALISGPAPGTVLRSIAAHIPGQSPRQIPQTAAPQRPPSVVSSPLSSVHTAHTSPPVPSAHLQQQLQYRGPQYHQSPQTYSPQSPSAISLQPQIPSVISSQGELQPQKASVQNSPIVFTQNLAPSSVSAPTSSMVPSSALQSVPSSPMTQANHWTHNNAPKHTAQLDLFNGPVRQPSQSSGILSKKVGPSVVNNTSPTVDNTSLPIINSTAPVSQGVTTERRFSNSFTTANPNASSAPDQVQRKRINSEPEIASPSKRLDSSQTKGAQQGPNRTFGLPSVAARGTRSFSMNSPHGLDTGPPISRNIPQPTSSSVVSPPLPSQNNVLSSALPPDANATHAPQQQRPPTSANGSANGSVTGTSSIPSTPITQSAVSQSTEQQDPHRTSTRSASITDAIPDGVLDKSLNGVYSWQNLLNFLTNAPLIAHSFVPKMIDKVPVTLKPHFENLLKSTPPSTTGHDIQLPSWLTSFHKDLSAGSSASTSPAATATATNKDEISDSNSNKTLNLSSVGIAPATNMEAAPARNMETVSTKNTGTAPIKNAETRSYPPSRPSGPRPQAGPPASTVTPGAPFNKPKLLLAGSAPLNLPKIPSWSSRANILRNGSKSSASDNEPTYSPSRFAPATISGANATTMVATAADSENNKGNVTANKGVTNGTASGRSNDTAGNSRPQTASTNTSTVGNSPLTNGSTFHNIGLLPRLTRTDPPSSSQITGAGSNPTGTPSTPNYTAAAPTSRVPPPPVPNHATSKLRPSSVFISKKSHPPVNRLLHSHVPPPEPSQSASGGGSSTGASSASTRAARMRSEIIDLTNEDSD